MEIPNNRITPQDSSTNEIIQAGARNNESSSNNILDLAANNSQDGRLSLSVQKKRPDIEYSIRK